MDDDYINLLKSKYPPIIVEEAPEPCLNYDVHGPRLMISKIEIENFKSYGGIKILGPFHKNFSCIIGPNGSGKSNVIDSLLFVFGFRANKIRSKKLSVLIHKSERFPNISSCSVRVYFQRIKSTGDGDNDFEVIESSEFVVTRTAFKDNTSIYKINDRKVVNKEVIEFLKKQGIDLDHNRFLILQGEVEQIALMKPKASNEYEDGLLEYLEDIIGSHRFKEPLDLLFKRLEELCELRTEKLNRVKVVGKEKKDLEGDRNEAVKYLRLCNEITIRKNISFQIKMKELNLLEVSALEKQNEVKKELEQIKSDVDKINKLRSEKEKELKQTVQQHLMKEQQFDLCKKQFSDLEVEDTELRDQRKHCKLKLDELGKAIKLKEKEIIKYEHVPDESIPRIEQLMGEIEKLEELKQIETKSEEKTRGMVNEETKELQHTRDIKMTETRKQQDLLTKQEAEIKTKKCELDCLIGNYQKEEKSYLDLELKQKSTRERIERTKEKLKNLSESIPKMNHEYSTIQEELRKLKTEQTVLNTDIAQLNFNLQSSKLKREEHKIINFLLEQQRLGKLKGIVGRLGNLGSIDQKYDVAISTACRRLDSIVTSNISDAQHCVELMKAHDIGLAEFLAFDKIRHWEKNADKPFAPIPGAPRAMDLLIIKNPDLRSIFYFALRDLLISQDTRDSARINKGHTKFRIVTMKGEITGTDRSVTGGGNRIISGKICTDNSKIQESGGQNFSNVQSLNIGDSNAMEKSKSDKELKLDEISKRIENLSRSSEELRLKITEDMNNQKKCQTELKHLCVDESENTKNMQALHDKVMKTKPDQKKVESMEILINQLSADYDNASQSIKLILEDIEKINDEIKSVGAARLSAVTARLQATEEKINDKVATLKKIQQSVRNAEKILKRAVTCLEQLKKDKETHEDKFKEMDVTLKELEERAEKTLKAYEQTRKEVDELMLVKTEHSTALSKYDDDLKNSKHIIVQINQDFEEKKSKVDQIKDRIRLNQEQLKKLTFYTLPDGVEENMDDFSFMEFIGESSDSANVFSSQSDCHIGTKLKIYNDDELQALKVHQITYQDMEDKLQQQKPNIAAIEDYRMKEELYMQRAAELNEVTELRDSQRELLEKLKRQRHQEFTAGFNLITGKLKEMYQMITMGGDAELELVDSLDPFSEGIMFSVRPPKKSWKNISNLSGGEKTLSSLALVFALHHFKPTPFYVMDEIDAALDFKNVSIVANYLKERTKNAQFIIISLRNNMYELSDRHICIYKPFNVSKATVVNSKELDNCLRATKKSTQQKPDLLSPSQPDNVVDLDRSGNVQNQPSLLN